MAGSELLGKLELEYIQELFTQEPAILYRYHPKAFMVKRFEEAVARRLNVKYAHAVSSGTAAIETALYSAGVRPGDEVITTAFTFVAPIEAILKLGAIPVCVEVDETLHMDPKEVEKAISDRTKVVCAIPMWGPCDMASIVEVCNRRNVILVEDAAQCLGGTFNGKQVGTFGQIGSFSLDFGKTLSAGEGGFVITNDEETYKIASEYADHGHIHDLSVPRGQDGVRFPGFNYRVSELTGAVAFAQLTRLDDILARQRSRMARLREMLGSVPAVNIRNTADPSGDTGDTLILQLPSKEHALRASEALLKQGIGTKILPEAFRWHYAGEWNHVWSHVGGYEGDLCRYWPRTHELLSRSIALGVSVNQDTNWDEMVTRVLHQVMG